MPKAQLQINNITANTGNAAIVATVVVIAVVFVIIIIIVTFSLITTSHKVRQNRKPSTKQIPTKTSTIMTEQLSP
jgi:heme/copper-type cytochrome/quinol oxidase subunit 2